MKIFICLLLLFSLLIIPAESQPNQTGPPLTDMPQGNPTASSKGEQEEVDKDSVLKIRTSLVTIPVAAMAANGSYLNDLRREDFQIYEDGAQQEIAFFSDAEQPLAIILLIDTSVSVSSSWRAIGRAVEDFLDQLRPKDTVLPMAFDSTIRVPLTRGTNDHALLRATIQEMLSQPSEGSGGTRLFDAIDFINKHVLPGAQGARKSVIVFSDGMDSTSGIATRKGTLNDVEEAGAIYYTLHFASNSSSASTFSDSRRRSDLRAARRQGFEYLLALSDRTGGRLIDIEKLYPDMMRKAFASVAAELRHLYSLSYYPQKRATPKKRQIRVKVSRAGVKVQARKSYITNR